MSPSPASPWHLAQTRSQDSRPSESWAAPGWSWPVRRCRSLSKVGLRDDLDRGRHDGVQDPAELGAAALVDALLRRREAQLVGSAHDGVALSSELGHPPAVVHVMRHEHEPDGPVDRQHEVVDGDLAVRIDVLPVELVALDLDHELVGALAARRLDRRRAGEDDDGDSDEDDGRDQRPDDLEPRVSVDLRALDLVAGRPPAAKADDEEDERALDCDEDDGADGEDEPVELVDRLAARGRRVRGADASVARVLPQSDRRDAEREHRERGDDDGGRRAPPHRPVRFYSARQKPGFATNVTRLGELQFTRYVVQ